MKQQLDREDIKEKDATSKLDSKKYADCERAAKQSDLAIGDRVVLSRTKRMKSDPSFGAEKYTIIAREGSKLVVRSDQGVVCARNVGDAKRAIVTPNIDSSDGVCEETTGIAFEDGETENSNVRPVRETRQPSKFKDMILYNIFQ